MTPALRGADWSDEAPQFRGHVSQMLQDIQTNDPDLLNHIGIEGPLGGFRTREQQEKIWQDPNVRVKARPGESLHEQGLAADWHWDSPQAKQKLYDYASKHGLVFPVANDDGHMQLAGNPRLARESAENPSGMWDIMARVESSNGTDLSGPQTSSGQSQGMYGITTGTWKDFAGQAGVDLAQYPTPNSAPPQVQSQVAAVIPLARWDPKTVRAIESVYGKLDTSRPFGELAGGVPPALMTAGMTPAGKAAFDARNREIASLKEGIGAILKKMGETDPNDPELRALLRQHREFSQKLEQAYLNQAFHAPQRTEQTIFSQLGSLAMLVAVFGGFGSRGSAVGALNAAGAVMEAQNANNDRDYQDRMDVWKLQLNALQNANKMEGDQIQGILDEKRMSLTERHEALRDMFTALDLQRDLAELEVGNYDAIEKNQDQRIKTARDLEELAKTHEEVVKQRLENANMRAWGGMLGKDTEENQLVRSALMRRAKELNPNASDDQVLQDAQRLVRDPVEYPAAVQKAHEVTRKGVAERGDEPKPYTITSPDGQQQEEVLLSWMPNERQYWDAKNNKVFVPPTDPQTGQQWTFDPVPRQSAMSQNINQRLEIAANQASKAIGALTALPMGTTLGMFGGAQAALTGDPGDNFRRALLNKATPQMNQLMTTLSYGLSRSLATLEAGGVATGLVGLSDQMKAIVPQSGDKGWNVLMHFADMREIVEGATEVLLKNPQISKDMKQKITAMQNEIDRAIPFGRQDVVRLALTSPDPRNPIPLENVTDFANRIGAGGAATRTPNQRTPSGGVITFQNRQYTRAPAGAIDVPDNLKNIPDGKIVGDDQAHYIKQGNKLILLVPSTGQ